MSSSLSACRSRCQNIVLGCCSLSAELSLYRVMYAVSRPVCIPHPPLHSTDITPGASVPANWDWCEVSRSGFGVGNSQLRVSLRSAQWFTVIFHELLVSAKPPTRRFKVV